MEIFLISLLTLLASFIGTLTGFGLSTIMLPIFVLFYPLAQSLLIVGIIHFFSDLWKIILFKQGFDKKLVLYFGIPGIIAGVIGASIVLSLPQTLLSQTLGVFLITYSLFAITHPDYKISDGPPLMIAGGTLSGLTTGIFGIGGPIRTIFLAGLNLSKNTFVFTSGLLGLLTDSGRLLTYYLGGIRIEETLISGLIFFIPASLVGAKVAKLTIDKTTQKNFKKIILTFLLLIGLKLVLIP